MMIGPDCVVMCASYSMCIGSSHMRLDCTCEAEHQHWNRFNIRYYSGDLLIIPRISTEIG